MHYCTTTLKSMSARKTLSSRPLWSCLMRLRKLHRAHSLTKSSLFRFNTTFQSRSPYAGDDPFVDFGAKPKKNFNPRPPTRGTTVFVNPCTSDAEFQSTSPYAGDDLNSAGQPVDGTDFNPRPPTRGTTQTQLPPLPHP